MIQLPYECPEDFDDFWEQAVGEARAFPLEIFGYQKNAREHPTHEIDSFQFLGIDQTPRSGWVAAPQGKRNCSAFLWVPPYGRESKLPDEYGTRPGMASMSFNLHGESAFHREAYQPSRGYFAEGAIDPYTWIFRRFLQDCIIGLEVMTTLIQIDPERIGVSGMSQGGGLSIWLGALAPEVKAVAADMPFGSAFGYTLQNFAYRYPLKELKDFSESVPLGLERVLHTMSYFDTSFFASRCKVPTHVSLGLKDPASRPENVRCAYSELTGIRHLEELDWGHDWHPSMISNNLDWFQKHL